MSAFYFASSSTYSNRASEPSFSSSTVLCTSMSGVRPVRYVGFPSLSNTDTPLNPVKTPPGSHIVEMSPSVPEVCLPTDFALGNDVRARAVYSD